MKKLVLAVLAGALCIPAFAEPSAPVAEDHATQPVQAQPQPRDGDFKAAREKHEAQLKATQDKMTELVNSYKKLKGKKKEAKKAEIAQVVTEIRDKQIEFKEKQLADFEKRLNHMKAELAAQNTPQAKQAWVEEHTEKLIEQDGNMKALFGNPAKPGAKEGPQGPRGPHAKMGGKQGRPHPGRPDMKPGMEPFPPEQGLPPEIPPTQPENAGK